MKMQLKGVKATFDGLHLKLAETQQNHLKVTSKKIIEDLRSETPVDTGNARDSWVSKETSNTVVIENTAEYIKYLNEGSSKQAPAHFVERVALKYGTPLGAITESK